jgi:phosphoserine phosphatase RsbU/P
MLKSDELLNILKNTTLFAHVPDEILASIQDKVELVWLPAGSVIISQGESGEVLYLIVEGKVDIFSNGLKVTTCGPGECVGELTLLDDSPRMATIQTQTEACLLKLHRNDFYQALTTSWEVIRAMFRILGQKLRVDTDLRLALIREQEHLQQDLKRANEIQTAMLPREDLKLDWLHLTGKSQPAAVVGGDYYDYFRLPDNRVSLAVGDVAGHGFYSALLVAIVSSALQFQIEIEPDADSVMAALDKVVRNYRHTRMLMTFSYMMFYPTKRVLTFTNAGHPYPYFYRQKTQKWIPLKLDSLPLGALLPHRLKWMQLEWEPGDRLFLYSDGLTDVQNAAEEEFGVNALENFLKAHATVPPAEIIKTLYKTLDKYRRGVPLADDVTAVVVKFL